MSARICLIAIAFSMGIFACTAGVPGRTDALGDSSVLDIMDMVGDSLDLRPGDDVLGDLLNCNDDFESNNYAGQCLSDGDPEWGIDPSPIGVCNDEMTCCREIRAGDYYLTSEEVDRLHRSCRGASTGESDCYRKSPGETSCEGGCYCVYCYKEFCLAAQCDSPCLPPSPDAEGE